MLKDAAAGRGSSWAVRWHASAFLQNCYSLYSARSLVSNKGFDSGTHFENDVSSQQECDARPVPVTPQPVAKTGPCAMLTMCSCAILSAALCGIDVSNGYSINAVPLQSHF